MDLKEIMQHNDFVVCGDTLNADKYAYKIKNALIAANYNVFCVGKELADIDSVPIDNFILDLCINPKKGLDLLKATSKNIKCVLIQPGAESLEIIAFLEKNSIKYLQGCALVGLKVYPR